jgi:hypothetical protein
LSSAWTPGSKPELIQLAQRMTIKLGGMMMASVAIVAALVKAL